MVTQFLEIFHSAFLEFFVVLYIRILARLEDFSDRDGSPVAARPQNPGARDFKLLAKCQPAAGRDGPRSAFWLRLRCFEFFAVKL